MTSGVTVLRQVLNAVLLGWYTMSILALGVWLGLSTSETESAREVIVMRIPVEPKHALTEHWFPIFGPNGTVVAWCKETK
jgi:hypothetical protein